MNADRFTIKSQEALQAAIDVAAGRRHSQVAPEHLLAVLLEQPEGMTLAVLRKLGASPEAIRAQVNSALDALPSLSTEAEATTAPELTQTAGGRARRECPRREKKGWGGRGGGIPSPQSTCCSRSPGTTAAPGR